MLCSATGRWTVHFETQTQIFVVNASTHFSVEDLWCISVGESLPTHADREYAVDLWFGVNKVSILF